MFELNDEVIEAIHNTMDQIISNGVEWNAAREALKYVHLMLRVESDTMDLTDEVELEQHIRTKVAMAALEDAIKRMSEIYK
jgi:hypothetical protein